MVADNTPPHELVPVGDGEDASVEEGASLTSNRSLAYSMSAGEVAPVTFFPGARLPVRCLVSRGGPLSCDLAGLSRGVRGVWPPRGRVPRGDASPPVQPTTPPPPPSTPSP